MTSMPTKTRPSLRRSGASPARFPVAGGELGLHRRPADGHVGAVLCLERHAEDRAQGLAVEQEDALVALARRRHVLLGHHPVAPARGEQLEHRRGVAVTTLEQHHALAAVAIHRLDDGAVGRVLDEGTELRQVAVTSVSG